MSDVAYLAGYNNSKYNTSNFASTKMNASNLPNLDSVLGCPAAQGIPLAAGIGLLAKHAGSVTQRTPMERVP
jgi:hypothetical protein